MNTKLAVSFLLPNISSIKKLVSNWWESSAPIARKQLFMGTQNTETCLGPTANNYLGAITGVQLNHRKNTYRREENSRQNAMNHKLKQGN